MLPLSSSRLWQLRQWFLDTPRPEDRGFFPASTGDAGCPVLLAVHRRFTSPGVPWPRMLPLLPTFGPAWFSQNRKNTTQRRRASKLAIALYPRPERRGFTATSGKAGRTVGAILPALDPRLFPAAFPFP